MENLTLRIAKIVGTPTANSWSQVHTFFPEESEKKERRGIFLGVLSFSGGGEGVEAVSFGREILSRLHEEYFGELETPAMEKLSQAVSKVASEFSKEGQNLEVVAAALLKNVLYLACSGSGQVWVKRGGALQKVLEGKEEIETASGILKEDDFIVLGTSAFFALLPEGILRAALESGSPDEAVEVLAPVIHGKDKQSLLLRNKDSQAAALICQFQEEISSQPEVQEKKKKNFEKIFSFFSPVFQKFKTLRLGKIYIRDKGEETKKKKVALTLAIILIFLLGASIFFGKGKKESSERERQYNLIFSEARASLEEGKALVSLNPSSARELIFKSQEKLSELEDLKIQTQKTSQLRQEVEEALFLVSKEHKLSEVPTFLDLALFRQGGRGEDLSLFEKFLAVLDPRENILFWVDISQKSGEILAGGENLSGSKKVSSYGDYVYVLDEEGIVRVGVKNKKTEVVIEPDWKEAKLLSAFAGNLYLLDNKGIWRYQATEVGFSEKQKWFGEGVSADLSEVVSMAIDGSIWLLRQDGKILKFSQGSPEAFGVAGLDKPFSSPSVIYTDSEAENLYILDKGNSRIVVLTKGGEYQGQYIWEGIKEASDMVVSEKEEKIFLLSGEKIYKIDIK